jgi:lambda family phage tail tape measure protein
MATVEDFKVKISVDGENKLDRLASGAEQAKAKIEGLATAMLGVGFAAFIHSAIEMADRISDLSDATGLAIGSIKGFEDALAAAGGKARNTERIITTFYQTMETALQGSDQARDSFQKLGISLDDLKNKSEADLLSQAITQLAGMEEGSTRTALATSIFGKSIRAVDLTKFLQELKDGKISAFEAADAIKAGGDAADRMDKQIRTLQEGALLAIDPILKLFGGTEVTAKSASTAIQVLGGLLAAAMGAAAIANILAVVKALQEFNLVTKIGIGLQAAGLALQGPKAWATLAAAAGVATAAIIAINKALDENNAKLGGGKLPGPTTGNVIEPSKASTGPANRASELSAQDKALIESRKAAAQALANVDRNNALASSNDIMAIEVNAQADIARLKLDIAAKEKEQKIKLTGELNARIKEIESKAALDTAKARTALNVKIATEEMAQAEQSAKEMADYYKLVDQARVQALGQVRGLQEQTQQLQARFELQKAIIDLGTIDQERQNKIFDAIQQQKTALDQLNAIKDLPNDERLVREQQINDEYAKRIGLINAEADAKLAREQDFSAGVRSSMKKYQESLTPLKQGEQIADSVFNNMGSALDKFVTTGKFNFQDFAASVVQDLIKIQLRAAATQLFNSVLGMFGFSLPGKAIGGPVSPGKPYMVGERGPELFMPNSAGTIVPNNKLGGSSSGSIGGGTTIINNISALDSRSVQQLFAEHRMTLFGNVEQARRELPMRTR